MEHAIRFPYFVPTKYRAKFQAWAESHARGDYVFDSGDVALTRKPGIEFEREDDALQAVRRFGGVYVQRQVLSTDDGQQLILRSS